MTTPLPLACNMTAIPADQRSAHHALIHRLAGEVATEIRDVANGIAFSFPSNAYDEVVRFVALERLCCSFLHFTLDVPSPDRSLTLTVTGPPGAREFIRAELGLATS
jgi:hypothetical protein